MSKDLFTLVIKKTYFDCKNNPWRVLNGPILKVRKGMLDSSPRLLMTMFCISLKGIFTHTADQVNELLHILPFTPSFLFQGLL